MRGVSFLIFIVCISYFISCNGNKNSSVTGNTTILKNTSILKLLNTTSSVDSIKINKTFDKIGTGEIYLKNTTGADPITISIKYELVDGTTTDLNNLLNDSTGQVQVFFYKGSNPTGFNLNFQLIKNAFAGDLADALKNILTQDGSLESHTPTGGIKDTLISEINNVLKDHGTVILTSTGSFVTEAIALYRKGGEAVLLAYIRTQTRQGLSLTNAINDDFSNAEPVATRPLTDDELIEKECNPKTQTYTPILNTVECQAHLSKVCDSAKQEDLSILNSAVCKDYRVAHPTSPTISPCQSCKDNLNRMYKVWTGAWQCSYYCSGEITKPDRYGYTGCTADIGCPPGTVCGGCSMYVDNVIKRECSMCK